MLLVAAILLAIFVLPSPWGLVAVAAAAVLEVAEAMVILHVSRRRRSVTGAEGLVGAAATVVESCRPDGRVRVHGELWRARADGGAEAGEQVRVLAVDGLTLLVERD